jgi:hypothetical protein
MRNLLQSGEKDGWKISKKAVNPVIFFNLYLYIFYGVYNIYYGGSLKTALVGCLDQARTASEIHLEVSNLLMDLSKDGEFFYPFLIFLKKINFFRSSKIQEKLLYQGIYWL